MFSVKPPKIKRRTVAVPVKKAPVAPAAKSAQSNGHARAAPAPGNRYNLTPSAKATAAHAQSRDPGRKSVAVSRVQKRKVEPSTPQWGVSSDEEDEDDDDDSRKRQKLSSSIEPMGLNRCLEPDYSRRIRIVEPASTHTNGALPEQENGTSAKKTEKGKDMKLIHGRAMSRGDWARDFKRAFAGGGEIPMVHLQYPSTSQPERFECVLPKDNTNFNPLEDIYYTIEEIVQHYLPAELAAELSSEADGTVRLLKRAVSKNSPEDFSLVLEQFNKVIRQNLDNGVIAGILDSKHAIPLSLVKRILAQVYQRTVSPHAHLLRQINKKAKETTYGELLPPFVHAIFQQTGLNSGSVFVDLGSGVGNVVLQSALQTGAESHGIEIMDRAAAYANNQASELRARSKLWNISLGSITLLHGDFLESPETDAALRRADVVLVNNKVFPQKLNGKLLDKFLDLKDGCKVVSLASFGGGGRHGVRSENSIANLFDEERFDSGTNSVSWAGESVEYFIMTKRSRVRRWA
ncbi:Nucleosomal histone H3-Lys79 methylase [Kalmusia sp. IMI 367209]|nr:Nucleosomal histone H3-Lys79 methylase [Kalmusia sp. IMI 367209]